MNLLNIASNPFRKWNSGKILLLDSIAFLFVWLTLVISHLIGFPFYMIEPMRFMVILSIVYASRGNSYLLALTLPLFSWVVSGHPEFFKTLVMTAELVLNVFLFYYLVKRIDSVFLSMVISIVVSKIFCYALYLVFFSIMFIEEEAEPVFLIAQVITTVLFSSYVSIILQKKKSQT